MEDVSREGRERIDHWVRPQSGPLKPPLRMRRSEKLYFSVQVDPERVQPHLPRALRASTDGVGILSAFTVRSGDAGAWSGAVFGVAVNGYNSPTGMQAVYWTCVYADHRAYPIFRDNYSADTLEGSARLRREGDRVHAQAWSAEGRGEIDMVMRITGTDEYLYDGAYHYMGSDGVGGARVLTVIGHDRHVVAGEMESVTITADASAGLLALKPVALSWGVYHHNVDLVMGPARGLDAQEADAERDATRGLLLAAFDHLRWPALVVDAQGIIWFRNRAADERLGSALSSSSHLSASMRTGFDELRGALRDVSSGNTVAEPVALVLQDEQRVIATVSSLDHRLAGVPATPVTLSAPNTKPLGNTADLLRLLGLTESEARLAASIGTGLPTRTVASQLGIAETTAKSTLKVVFEKLQIARRSELSRIVARLEML